MTEDDQLAVASDWLMEKDLHWAALVLKSRDLLYMCVSNYIVGDACDCRNQLPDVVGHLEHHLPACEFGKLLIALGGEGERQRQVEGGHRVANSFVSIPDPYERRVCNFCAMPGLYPVPRSLTPAPQTRCGNCNNFLEEPRGRRCTNCRRIRDYGNEGVEAISDWCGVCRGVPAPPATENEYIHADYCSAALPFPGNCTCRTLRSP